MVHAVKRPPVEAKPVVVGLERVGLLARADVERDALEVLDHRQILGPQRVRVLEEAPLRDDEARERRVGLDVAEREVRVVLVEHAHGLLAAQQFAEDRGIPLDVLGERAVALPRHDRALAAEGAEHLRQRRRPQAQGEGRAEQHGDDPPRPAHPTRSSGARRRRTRSAARAAEAHARSGARTADTTARRRRRAIATNRSQKVNVYVNNRRLRAAILRVRALRRGLRDAAVVRGARFTNHRLRGQPSSVFVLCDTVSVGLRQRCRCPGAPSSTASCRRIPSTTGRRCATRCTPRARRRTRAAAPGPARASPSRACAGGATCRSTAGVAPTPRRRWCSSRGPARCPRPRAKNTAPCARARAGPRPRAPPRTTKWPSSGATRASSSGAASTASAGVPRFSG